MQENRFTYSPVVDTTSFRGPLSFQEVHSRTLAGQQPSFELPKWTPPPAFTISNPPLYTPNQFVASLPPNRQVTFGQGIQSTSEAVRITFNQNSGTSVFAPNFYNPPPQPAPASAPEANKIDPPAPVLNSGVNNFVVDTNDFKYVKESQFTGCFHCFSPVTYSTKSKKGLCG